MQLAQSTGVLGVDVANLAAAYAAGATTPSRVVGEVTARIAERGDDGTWISVASLDDLLSRAAELETDSRSAQLELYGIPFAVKDSIDVAGWPTTLACPAYAYTARHTAPVVQRLLDAGAILVGKTNLDQFATGLNGTRTPYTVPRSVYGGDLISGGSSSGSALAVALGEVPFAVATDTAGSGRVPPALNSVLGYKPSRGLISTVGLIPACRSLDCISLMARTVDDLALLLDVVAGVDERDPWSRDRGYTTTDLAALRVGLPAFDELEFFGDTAMAAAHQRGRSWVAELFSTVQPPLEPFVQAGELLYSGPWVAERTVEFGDFIAEHGDGVLPVIAQIIGGGARFDAQDVFRAQYRLAELKAEVGRLWVAMDVLVLPTIGTTFTVPEVLADPIATNTKLGHYTHFGNLLDLCGIAVPAGTTADGRPASLLVLGPALSDDTALAVARALATAHPTEIPRPVRRTLPVPESELSYVEARPTPFPLPPGQVALVVIDMQRDFLLPGGFGETLGNDVSQLAAVIPPLQRLLAAAREAGLLVVHTREGHRPDLSDLSPAKYRRGKPSLRIGDPGPYGRILVQGEYGHDIIDELAPIEGETVIDKPGKGAFYATDFGDLLAEHQITSLIVTGVTTEVCVHTTVREANDRGYECLVPADCVGSYFPEFQRVGLDMVAAQGGIFGWVADSAAIIEALRQPATSAA